MTSGSLVLVRALAACLLALANIPGRRQIVRGPFTTDSASYLAVPANFHLGCEFSLSLWVWLYRPRECRDQDLYVFSTRRTIPFVDEPAKIFPTILFNMLHRNQFFFSYQLDDAGLHFGAYWAEEVRYHEWIHLAMTLDSREFRGYVNGKLVGALATADGSRECSPTNITNTVLHVMGKKSERSTSGMVEHMMLHEHALSQDEIREVMLLHPHSRLPYIHSLLSSQGKYSLEGLSILDWRGHGYLQLSWGLCPEAVCGELCLDEAVVFGGTHRSTRGRDDLHSLLPWKSSLRQDRVFKGVASDVLEPASHLPRPTTNRSALLNESLFHGFPPPAFTGKQLIEYQRIERLYEMAVGLLSGKVSLPNECQDVKGNEIRYSS